MVKLVGRAAKTSPSNDGVSEASSSFGVDSVASNSSDADANLSDNDNGGLESDQAASSRDCELRRLKRRAQTEKARAAAAVAREKRKAAKAEDVPEHAAARFKPDLQPEPEINRPGNYSLLMRWRRLRVIVSWFQAWCSSLERFLQTPTANHCFTTNVVDDTNMVLSDVIDSTWLKSRVVSVMNSVQSLVVCYNDDNGDECHRTFMVHCPPVCLPKTDAATLVWELKAWILTFLGRVSSRFEIFGLTSTRFEAIPIQGTILCWDSLKTNVSLHKHLRLMVHVKHQCDGFAQIFPLLANVCMIHQLALARRPIVYHYNGLWSSIVRLSHLFEVSTFRQQFRSALIRVICSNFQYIEVAHPPTEAKAWRHSRNRICNLVSADPSYSRKRRRLHMGLMTYDNGNPSADMWTHWCHRSCCVGSSAQERSNFALLQVCKFMVLLYAHGFAVLLLYRWVHAPKALQFVNASWVPIRLRVIQVSMLHVICQSQSCKSYSDCRFVFRLWRYAFV